MLNVFEKVWSMSVTASAVILVVLLARLLLKRAPKILSYALWAVVLFRLLCPLSWESSVSLIPEPALDTKAPALSFKLPDPRQSAGSGQEGSGSALSGPVELSQDALTVPNEVVQSIPADSLEPVQTGESEREETFRFPLEWVWFGGAVLLALISAARYGCLRRRLRQCILVKENIYLADGIPTAFVTGVIRPRIYLPSDMPEDGREYVLAHERCHIHRGDPLIRLLSFGALCLHWFNPLVWLAFYLAGQDMEMSCDEAVVRRLGADIRGGYARSLLELSVGRKLFTFTPLAFGEGSTGKRIRNLGKWKKPVLWAVVLVAVLCAVLAVCLLTDPKQEATTLPAEPDTQTPLPHTNVSIPEGEFSYPFYGIRAQQWFSGYENAQESIELDCFPGVKFHSGIRAENMQTGEVTSLYTGMPVQNCYFADLTGDGLPELCSAVFYGSGAIDSHIVIYDYAKGQEYTLWDRMEYDYYLGMVDGVLWAWKTPYRAQNGEYAYRDGDSYGPLVLLQQGDTMVPVIWDKSDQHYEMAPTDSSMIGAYDGYLFIELHGRTYRYQRYTVDPEGLTPDADLGIYFENTIHDFDRAVAFQVYSTKEYADHTVLLVNMQGTWMSYRYAPARRISEATWDSIRSTEGIVVLENGSVISGKEYFLSFAEKTWAGEACVIQTASYHTLDPDRMVDQLYQTVAEDYPCLYVHTLSYDGAYYTITWEENGEVITKQYRYLMRYTGTPARESADYSMYIRYVLTNDNTVTWDDIFNGMISSQLGAYIDHYTVYTDYLS